MKAPQKVHTAHMREESMCFSYVCSCGWSSEWFYDCMAYPLADFNRHVARAKAEEILDGRPDSDSTTSSEGAQPPQ